MCESGKIPLDVEYRRTYLVLMKTKSEFGEAAGKYVVSYSVGQWARFDHVWLGPSGQWIACTFDVFGNRLSTWIGS